MNPDHLRDLARRFSEGGDSLDAVGTFMQSALFSVPWQGPDAEACRLAWESQHLRVIEAAAAVLRDAAERLRQELVAQEAASAPEGPLHGIMSRGPDSGPSHTAIASAPPPISASPEDNARWWSSLPPVEQQRLLKEQPESIGNRDGVPGAIRHLANASRIGEEKERLREEADRLREDLEDNWFGGTFTDADAALKNVEGKLDGLERVEKALLLGGRQLLVLDIEGELLKAAVAVGDVDKANHVAVFTPGFSSNVQSSLLSYDRDMAALQASTLAELDRKGRGEETVAAVTWLGYEPPQGSFDRNFHKKWDHYLHPDRSVASDNLAQQGGEALSRFFNGLNAARVDDAHLTALGHSYGSTTTGFSLQRPTGVDDAVFFGSPGTGVSDQRQLQVPEGHIFTVEARRDPVADLGRFGGDPNLDPSQTPLSAGEAVHPDGSELTESTGHSAYLSEGTTSQYNISLVVGGMGEDVMTEPAVGFGDGIRRGLPLPSLPPAMR